MHPRCGLTSRTLGDLRWITSFTCKTWERYGIHALEAVEPLLGPGFLTVQAHSDAGGDVMHLTHRSGVKSHHRALCMMRMAASVPCISTARRAICR
jgi:hypothetical protein